MNLTIRKWRIDDKFNLAINLNNPKVLNNLRDGLPYPYMEKDAEDFIANKSKFFGLVITDEEIIIKVLESIDEYYNEGKTQGICVFGSGYYKKADTLILSARIGDEIIETVEVDLRTLEVVQCHGKHNQDTEYHERIIDLVNKNANLIRERMKAA